MGYGTGSGGGGGSVTFPSQMEIVGTEEQGFPITGASDIPNPVVMGIIPYDAIVAWDGKITTDEGGIATLGERSDATASNHTGSWSLIALIKRLASLLVSGIPVFGENIEATPYDTEAARPVTMGFVDWDGTVRAWSNPTDHLPTVWIRPESDLTVNKALPRTLTERGGTTAGTTSVVIMNDNNNRDTFIFQNVSDTDMWLRFGYTAATTAAPSLKMPANMATPFVLTGFAVITQVNLICSASGKGYSAWENYYNPG